MTPEQCDAWVAVCAHEQQEHKHSRRCAKGGRRGDDLDCSLGMPQPRQRESSVDAATGAVLLRRDAPMLVPFMRIQALWIGINHAMELAINAGRWSRDVWLWVQKEIRRSDKRKPAPASQHDPTRGEQPLQLACAEELRAALARLEAGDSTFDVARSLAGRTRRPAPRLLSMEEHAHAAAEYVAKYNSKEADRQQSYNLRRAAAHLRPVAARAPYAPVRTAANAAYSNAQLRGRHYVAAALMRMVGSTTFSAVQIMFHIHGGLDHYLPLEYAPLNPHVFSMRLAPAAHDGDADAGNVEAAVVMPEEAGAGLDDATAPAHAVAGSSAAGADSRLRFVTLLDDYRHRPAALDDLSPAEFHVACRKRTKRAAASTATADSDEGEPQQQEEPMGAIEQDTATEAAISSG